MSRGRARDRSRPSGGAAWTPARLSSLAAWYRADLGVTLNGSNVSAWADQSGNGRHATQGTGAEQPGQPATVAALGSELALSYDGGDILGANGASMDVDLSSQWGFCTVFRLASLGNFRGLFRVSTGASTGTTADDGLVAYTGTTGGITIADPGAGTNWYREAPNGTLSANVGYALLGYCATGNALGITLELGTISAGSISWATLSLNRAVSADCTPLATGRFMFPGGGWTSGASRLTGDLGEQFVRGTAWSAAEIALIKTYLLKRYG